MRQISEGLRHGLDFASVYTYADPVFNGFQMNEIRIGMESGLDVSVYMDPEYTNEQMKQIRYGMDHNIDVSRYADPSISASDMEKSDSISNMEPRLPEISI